MKLRVWSDAIGQMTAEDPGRALWMISTLVDRELGEVGAMACLDGLGLVDDDCDGSPIMLTELRGKLSDMGCPVGISAEECLDVYSTYRLNPPEEDLDWRMDVTVGSTCCAPLVSDYIKAEEDAMNDLQANGATAGFVFYPVEKFDGDTDAMHRFREDVIATIASKVENDTVRFIGWGDGRMYAYIDFIAWDIGQVLNAARDALYETDVERAFFHTFRRDAGAVILFDKTRSGVDSEPEFGTR